MSIIQTSADGKHRIAVRHAEYLQERAVELSFAVQAGLQSVDAETGAHVLGLSGPLESGGLAIPYPACDYVRVRMDSGGAKFMSPVDKSVPIYVPPGCPIASVESLAVVEGPVKALSLQGHGIHAIGLGGTGTCLTTDGDRRLNESWGALTVRGRRIVIVFDSNRTTNPNVARDEARLAIALERAGADVRLAALPHHPNGEAWGPDDYLAHHGVAGLQAVIAAAVPADPVKRVLEVLG